MAMRKLVLAVMILLGLRFVAQATEVPGGVIYVKDGTIVYRDLSTSQVTELQKSSASPIRSAAISENGRVLAWASGDGFYTRLMPTGEVCISPYYDNYWQYNSDSRKHASKTSDLIPWAQKTPKRNADSKYAQISSERARNLSVSNEPRGAFFAFESEEQTSKWVFIPGATETRNNVTRDEITPDGRHKVTKIPREVIPAYRYVYTSFTTVSILPSAIPTMLPNPADRRNGFTVFFGCFASAETTRPICDSFKAIGPDNRAQYTNGDKNDNKAGPNRREEARNARFPAWSKTEPKVALVYHDSKDWGPIEVYQCGPDIGIAENPKRPDRIVTTGYTKVQEIPYQLGQCNGLAWRPDGTLTCLFGSNVYVINGPAVVQGISATKFCWVSNDTLVFRHPAGALYGWKGGKTEKLLDSVPEEFSYCAVNPLTAGDAPVAKKAQ